MHGRLLCSLACLLLCSKGQYNKTNIPSLEFDDVNDYSSDTFASVTKLNRMSYKSGNLMVCN